MQHSDQFISSYFLLHEEQGITASIRRVSPNSNNFKKKVTHSNIYFIISINAWEGLAIYINRFVFDIFTPEGVELV